LDYILIVDNPTDILKNRKEFLNSSGLNSIKPSFLVLTLTL
jgi:hypothetical protein